MDERREDGVEVTANIYSSTLSDYIKDLNVELEKVNENIVQSEGFLSSLEKRKTEIMLEIERVTKKREQVVNSEDIEGMGLTGSLVKGNSEKITEIAEKSDILDQEISDLRDDYNNSDSVAEKMVLDVKIRYREMKLESLRDKTIKFTKRQRSIVVIKHKLDVLKNKGTIKQERKIALAEVKATEAQEKINLADDSDSVLSTLSEKVNEVKVKHYKRKAERAREVLAQMDGRSFIKGARAIAIAKIVGGKLKDNLSGASSMEALLNPLNVTPEEAPAKTM